ARISAPDDPYLHAVLDDFSRSGNHRRRRGFRGREGKAGRAPGTLADADGAGPGEAMGERLDALRGEDAALGRREMFPDKHLDRGDRRAEGVYALFDQRRHDAGQHMPAYLADAAGGEGRKQAERLDLVLAMQSVLRLVEYEDDAPFVG